jgi:hypothetical protein
MTFLRRVGDAKKSYGFLPIVGRLVFPPSNPTSFVVTNAA